MSTEGLRSMGFVEDAMACRYRGCGQGPVHSSHIHSPRCSHMPDIDCHPYDSAASPAPAREPAEKHRATFQRWLRDGACRTCGSRWGSGHIHEWTSSVVVRQTRLPASASGCRDDKVTKVRDLCPCGESRIVDI